jgi:pyruvate formate lyase activating enzyme
VKEPYLYKTLPDKKVKCRTCAHFCVLTSKKRGKYGVRENIDGRLYSLS